MHACVVSVLLCHMLACTEHITLLLCLHFLSFEAHLYNNTLYRLEVRKVFISYLCSSAQGICRLGGGRYTNRVKCIWYVCVWYACYQVHPLRIAVVLCAAAVLIIDKLSSQGCKYRIIITVIRPHRQIDVIRNTHSRQMNHPHPPNRFAKHDDYSTAQQTLVVVVYIYYVYIMSQWVPKERAAASEPSTKDHLSSWEKN